MAAGCIQDICPDPAAGRCSQVQHRYILREAGLCSQSEEECAVHQMNFYSPKCSFLEQLIRLLPLYVLGTQS